ncbi:MAG: class I SAM-dependent RNA methyltransferase [Candidatus Izimaplasma sp.]|nr:class I SAM-dependent RNA methyltransferase [Candidatus Izimaplasma bacterium]
MENIELVATTTYGVEAVVKRELISLGYKVTKVESGKITFLSDRKGVANANLWLRSAERVFIKMDEFEARTFDELFDKTKNIAWEKYITEDGKFPVNGNSKKSKLFSISDSQSIIKKAVVERLKRIFKRGIFEETGPVFPIVFSINKDFCTMLIDTSGSGLHKRGYRVKTVAAPLRETLAASLVQLSFFEKGRVLYDPFCGSGTIPIEAAMIARNIAPGLNRNFAAKHWPYFKDVWTEASKEAYLEIDFDEDVKIIASDISEINIKNAQMNAVEAGVDDCIEFSVADFTDVKYDDKYAILISNPPYGERLGGTKKLKPLYKNLNKLNNKLDTWSKYYLSGYEDFVKDFSKKSNKKRRLFNGNIEAWFYQYYGPKPKNK